MHADRELLPWLQPLLSEIGDVKFVDIHTHVGLNDPAGFLARGDELVDALELIDAHGLVFPLKEPGGYWEANKRVREFASGSNGRLSTLARLDPADNPLGQAEEAIEAGAVGMKLHPRGEDFLIDDKRLDSIFALADERRLPIMVHDGVGVEAVGRHVLQRAENYPGARIVMAHCALLSLSWLWRELPAHPNVLVDTSWWNPADIMSVFRRVPPSQILYASDVPFGHPVLGAIATLRCGMQAGLTREQLRCVAGGQGARLLAHDDPVDVGPRPDVEEKPLDAELERVYVALVSSIEGLLRGEDEGQGFEIARAASRVSEDDPNAELMASIRELLDVAEDQNEPDPLRMQHSPGYDVAIVAAVLARTPAV